MNLYELVGEQENHPVYQTLEASNYERYYSFLKSIVETCLAMERPFLSQTVINAMNYHAIVCLHVNAGKYRPGRVDVGSFTPPPHYKIPDLMDDFVNMVNRRWEECSPTRLASFVLWRLNYIHPFVNGNGRTARAACYFVLCLKMGIWLGGKEILPALLCKERGKYVEALQAADKLILDERNKDTYLEPVEDLINNLLTVQLQG